jgi:hypothetical protein
MAEGKVSSISHAETLEEMAEFWDTHSLADYDDQTYGVTDHHQPLGGQMPSSKPRKTKRRRMPKRNQKRFDGLKRKLEQGPFQGRNVFFVVEPSGEVKISEALEDFVEPYLEFANTEEACRKLLTLAVIAWNVSFLPEEEQQDIVEGISAEVMPAATEEQKADLKGILSMLIARKKVYFSEYTRKIIGFELTGTGKGYYLSVASTLE